MHIDVMDLMIHRLRMNGWVRCTGSSVLGPFRMMEKEGKKVLVVRTLRLSLDTSLEEFARGFFLILRLYLAKHQVEKMYVQAGGVIKMPYFFLQYCRRINVEVIPVHPQKLNFSGFDLHYN